MRARGSPAAKLNFPYARSNLTFSAQRNCFSDGCKITPTTSSRGRRNISQIAQNILAAAGWIFSAFYFLIRRLSHLLGKSPRVPKVFSSINAQLVATQRMESPPVSEVNKQRRFHPADKHFQQCLFEKKARFIWFWSGFLGWTGPGQSVSLPCEGQMKKNGEEEKYSSKKFNQ